MTEKRSTSVGYDTLVGGTTIVSPETRPVNAEGGPDANPDKTLESDTAKTSPVENLGTPA